MTPMWLWRVNRKDRPSGGPVWPGVSHRGVLPWCPFGVPSVSCQCPVGVPSVFHRCPVGVRRCPV
eukprot:1934633-Pyramimonas_sp.AAC.1